MTNFEQRILATVNPMLAKNETASFFENSGTLFLNCGLVTLNKVTRALKEISNIDVNSVGGEFSVDFV